MATFFSNTLAQRSQLQGSADFTTSGYIRALAQTVGKQISSGVKGSLAVGASTVLTVTVGGTAYSWTYTDLGRVIRITSGPASGVSVKVTEIVSTSAVKVAAIVGVASTSIGNFFDIYDASNTEADFGYLRQDMTDIKGTAAWNDDLPTYTRPSDTGTTLNVSLANIAGKTLDSKALSINTLAVAIPIGSGATGVTLPVITVHAGGTNETGLPIFGVAPYALDFETTYVSIIDPVTKLALTVQTGPNIGETIYGRMAGGVSGSNLVIHFHSGLNDGSVGDHFYSWEGTQPGIVDIHYPTIKRFDEFSLNDFRLASVTGVIGDATNAVDIAALNVFTGRSSGQNNPVLTNTTASYVFSTIASPSASDLEEAVNTLNSEIGSRVFTGAILTNGQKVTASLQALSNAITVAVGTTTKLVYQVLSQLNPGSIITIPNSADYILDASGNGQGLDVYVAGVQQFPDSTPSATDGDYKENSTTTIMTRRPIFAGQVMTFIIRG